MPYRPPLGHTPATLENPLAERTHVHIRAITNLISDGNNISGFDTDEMKPQLENKGRLIQFPQPQLCPSFI